MLRLIVLALCGSCGAAEWLIPSPETTIHPGDTVPAASPISYPDAAGFATRAKLIVEGLAKEDLQKWRSGYFTGGDPGKYLPGAAMAKLMLDPEDAMARKFLNDERSPKEHYHFAAVNWARLLPIFGAAMELGTMAVLADNAAKATHYVDGGGTENHKTMWYTSRDGAQLTAVCFNDGRESDAFPLLVEAPPGTVLAGGCQLATRVRADGVGLEFVEETIVATGCSWSGTVAIPPMSARTLVFILAGPQSAQPITEVSQYFAPGILATVAPGETLTRRVRLPAVRPARARLKLVLADQDAGCRLSINGQAVPLPPAGTWTTRQDLDPALLSEVNDLAFTAGAQPMRVLMASIELLDER